MTTLTVVGIVCFCTGLVSGVVTMRLVSIDRVNKMQKGDTYE